MKLAIMQPYFLPYIGYFQLIEAADLFVVYDNIKYTKKGWINRNRMLQDGKDLMFSVPLKAGSDSLDVCQREVSDQFDRAKLLNKFREAYRRAPHFEQTFALLESVVKHEATNLFDYLHHSIVQVCCHLGIRTEIRPSTSVDIDHGLKAQDKVIALCQAVGATSYVNTIGGRDLYSKQAFSDAGVELQFIQPAPISYAQFGADFVPWLSIVDVLMFNSVDATRGHIVNDIILS